MLYDEQPTRFAQSWRQRKRWARGYLQVYGKYSRKLLCGIFRGSYSCFDALMSIMPALLLSVFGLSFNLAMGVLGLITNQDVMPAVISSLKSFGSSYLLMFGIGILTTVTEWKQIHTTTPKKLFYTPRSPFSCSLYTIALSTSSGKVMEANRTPRIISSFCAEYTPPATLIGKIRADFTPGRIYAES